MSQTLHYCDLSLETLLSVLPEPEVREWEYDNQKVLTILWHEPEHKRQENDLYGVEVRIKDNMLRVDQGHSICWNGQGLLQNRLDEIDIELTYWD